VTALRLLALRTRRSDGVGNHRSRIFPWYSWPRLYPPRLIAISYMRNNPLFAVKFRVPRCKLTCSSPNISTGASKMPVKNGTKRAKVKSKTAENYRHPESESLMRPEVGTQACRDIVPIMNAGLLLSLIALVASALAPGLQAQSCETLSKLTSPTVSLL
jgi:hypothetical protein